MTDYRFSVRTSRSAAVGTFVIVVLVILALVLFGFDAVEGWFGRLVQWFESLSVLRPVGLVAIGGLHS